MAAAPRRAFRQPALWIWIAAVAIAAAIAARSHYVADLSAFLPSAPTPEQAAMLDPLTSGTASRLVLVGIEGGDAAARAEASRRLGAAMRESGAFDSVNNGDTSAWEGSGEFLFAHRYLLSPAVDTERFSVDGLRAAMAETLSLLGTPAGTLIRPILFRDPTGETARMAEAMLPQNAPRSENGVWVSRVAARAILVATTRSEGSDLDGQEAALEQVRSAFDALRQPALRLTVTGPASFAVQSRAQIKTEVERLAIAGGVLMVGLLLLAFGRLRALGIAVLPVGSGVLVGIAAVSLGFGQVHGMTLGFGTTLIGEAVDYAIYYLIQARPPAAGALAERGATRWIRASWPTVRLGLLTSVCGFAALVFSGFPGLAQLGVFSVAGLCAAALTTRYLFPVLAPDGVPGTALRRRLGRFTGRATAALPRLRVPFIVLTIAAAIAVVLLPSPWRGSLASLSPVSAEDIRRDAELRADVGAPDAGLLVVVSAPTEAGVLEGAEAAGARLDRLVAAGTLPGYESPARLLPSPRTQLARRAALPERAALQERLVAATAGGPLPADRLGGFLDDVEAARRQAPLDRRALAGTPLATGVDALLIAGREGRPWRAMLSLHPSAAGIDPAVLRDALAGLEGTQVIDIKRELDGLYADYLRQALVQALVGAAAVCVLLAVWLRDARRFLGVVRPLAAAVVIVLATLTVLGVDLGILHLVGLLLVIAIGSNYTLFFDTLRQEGGADDDTLASLLLANLVAAAAFGLLALSSMPVLHAIGIVVAPGTFACLLLSAAFTPPPPGGYGRIRAPEPA